MALNQGNLADGRLNRMIVQALRKKRPQRIAVKESDCGMKDLMYSAQYSSGTDKEGRGSNANAPRMDVSKR
jgi:hypothetical protein